MMVLLTNTTRKARKDHRCDACYWLHNESSDIDYLVKERGITNDEINNIEGARKRNWKVKKGDVYVYQASVDNGEINIFKAIPAIHDICLKYGLYPEI